MEKRRQKRRSGQKPKKILFLLHKEFDLKKHGDNQKTQKGSLKREKEGERNEKTRGDKKERTDGKRMNKRR